MELAIFNFNPFQENTYLLYDETGECVILDPGCSNKEEEKLLSSYITKHNLKPVRLINTHCHIDHILGNKYISEKYNLDLEIHKGELETLKSGAMIAKMYGIPYELSPLPKRFIEDNDVVVFGNTALKAILTPGHSPASLSFYNEVENILIAGDVLFHESIGRTDLPGGNHQLLLLSIKNRVLTLPNQTLVFPGHGQKTTIGHERVNNPFLKELN